MADNPTTQAQHLTDLTVGIQGILDSFQKVREETDTTAEYIRQNIGKSLSNVTSGTGDGSGVSVGVNQASIKTSISAIESLNLSYKNFLNTLEKSKLDPTKETFSKIKTEAQSAAQNVEILTNAVKDGKTVSAEQAKDYQHLASQLKELKGEYKDAETQAYATGDGFKATGTAAKNAGGFVADFISKLSDKAKWLVTFQFITLIQNSFREVVSTIKETEDAVIELQRVLNDDTLANNTIADRLYDIAYRYGQTFENVQETAVLFAQTGKSWNEVLQATEATMLGLNTAELEVTTATQGLIAVMSQFKIPASELQGIIDKINITADNFPVTSEKIVAALQRSGSAAYNYGLTLEETIAIITALSEATGRAGANLGTALNSLINFTMKASSLEKFSEYLGGLDLSGLNVLEVWTLLGNSIKDGGEELAKLMAESKEFADLFSEEMADTVGAMDEYTAAVQNAEDVYSTAGVYRKNYFIALLNNIDTVTAALQNMGDAEGYSLSENEKYMESLTSQWNQLVIAAQELAVQFGETGFLDFAKFVVQVSTGTLKLTKDLGGLKTILIILLSLMVQIKKEKMKEAISNFSNGIVAFGKNLQNTLNSLMKMPSVIANYNRLVNAGVSSTRAWEMATADLKFSLAGITSVIAIVVSSISIIINKYEELKQKQKELREEAIKTGKTATEEAKKIFELFESYGESRDASKRTELLNLLGYSEEDFNYLLEKYEDLDTALKKLIDDRLQLLQLDAQEAVTKAKESYKDIGKEDISSATVENALALYNVLKNIEGINLTYTMQGLTGFVDIDFSAFEKAPKSVEEAKEKVAELELTINGLKKALVEQPEYAYFIQPFLDSVIKRKDVFQNFIKEVELAIEHEKLLSGSSEEVAQKIAELWEKASGGGTPDTISANLKKVEEEIKSIETAMDELNGKMDSFQSAYKTLESTIEEYNKTGILTADMMQELLKLDPQYLEMLELKNGKLELNKEKVDELIAVNDDYMTQLTALSIAEAYNTELKNAQAAANAGLTLSEYKLKFATADLNSDIYKLALQFVQGKVSSDDFKSGIAKAAEEAGLAKDYIKDLTNSVYDYGEAVNYVNGIGKFSPFTEQQKIDMKILDRKEVESKIGKQLRHWDYGKETYNEYQDYLIKELQNFYASRDKVWFPDDTKGKTAQEKFEQQLKDMRTEYQKWLKLLEGDLYLAQEKNASTDVIVNIYKKMQQEIHESANKYRDLGLEDNNEYIIELKKQWWKYQDEIDKLYSNDYNKFKKEQENKLSLLKNQYNGLESNLNELGKSTNLQEQADTYKKIMEAAHNEAERLRADGVEKNADAIQKAIDDWWKAYDSWKEINNKIATNVFDSFEDIISLADSLNVWDKLDFTKVDLLRDKLEAINTLFKEGTLDASDYKDALKDVGIALYNAEIERLKKLGENAETQNKADVEAINKNIEAIETLKKNSDDYYDGLIDNLKQVQEENQRVNDQLEYQNNRQKIITNLEQARARSGIEYRQKEMEYQQQLVDLDEDWRKKQEELNLTDQMEQLEALKKQAAEDFEKSIEQLNEQITRLNTGLEDTLEGLDKQAEELGKKIFDAINTGTKENLSEVGNQILFALDESKSPIEQKASVIGLNISNNMFGIQLENAAKNSAMNVFSIFKTNFLLPMDSAITQLMSKIMIPTSKDILNLGYGPLNPNKVVNSNSIIMYNNIPNVSAANSTIRGAQDIVNLNTNPSRF